MCSQYVTVPVPCSMLFHVLSMFLFLFHVSSCCSMCSQYVPVPCFLILFHVLSVCSCSCSIFSHVVPCVLSMFLFHVPCSMLFHVRSMFLWELPENGQYNRETLLGRQENCRWKWQCHEIKAIGLKIMCYQPEDSARFVREKTAERLACKSAWRCLKAEYYEIFELQFFTIQSYLAWASIFTNRYILLSIPLGLY